MSAAIAAVAGAGVLGGVAKGVTGAIASSKQKDSAKYAADAQLEGVQLGIDEQQRQFQAMQQLMNPYVNQGRQSLGAFNVLTGRAAPEKSFAFADGRELSLDEKREYMAHQLQQSTIDAANEGRWDMNKMDDLQMPDKFKGIQETYISPQEQQARYMERLANDPMVQARIEQGEESILNNASATGGLRGGNTQAALAQFAPQMIQDRINQEMGMLSGMITLGQGSAAGVGNAGMALGQNISNLYMDGAGATGNMHLAQGAASANAINGIGSAIGGALGGVGQIGGMHLGSKMMGGKGLSGAF